MTLQSGAPARETTVEFATGTFFRTLGIRVLAGRGIEPSDDVPGGAPSVVLSERLWDDLFARSPQVLGRTVQLNGHQCTIVGVAGAEYEGVEYSFYGRPALWASVQAYTPIMRTDRITRRVPLLMVFGRLKDGVTLAGAANSLQVLASQLSHEPLDTYRISGARVFPLDRVRVLRYGYEGLFGIVFTVAALTLAAGCFNISNLLITQGIGRQGELGLRLAMGATRGRLLRQLITECLVLGAVGGVSGALFSFGFAAALEKFPLENMVGSSISTPATIDGWAMLFTATATLTAVLTFGALPAALLSTRSPMRGVPRGDWASPRRSYARQVILAVQVGLSVLLSVTAGLYATSLFRVDAQRYPYDTEHIALARLNPTALTPKERDVFYDEVLDQVRRRSDVSAAALSGNPLLAIGSATVSAVLANRGVRSDFTTVGSDYFKTLQVPLIAGREFTDHEQALVAIVNQTLAQRLWPGQSAVGRTAYFPGLPPMNAPYTIVGVVDHARCQDQLEDSERPCVYRPIHTDAATPLMLHVRTAGSPAPILADLPTVIHRLNSAVVIDRLSTLSGHLGEIRSGPRVAAVMTGATATLASLLSAGGCAALLLALIAETRRDLAIRSAVGALRGGFRSEWRSMH